MATPSVKVKGVSSMDGKGLSEYCEYCESSQTSAAQQKLPRICSRGLPEDGKDGRTDLRALQEDPTGSQERFCRTGIRWP